MKQPTYSYVKSRGFYAGVQVDGTIVTERKDANAAFYGGAAVSVQQILRGEVSRVPGRDSWVGLVQPLFDTIKGAQGWHGQQQGGPSSPWVNQMGPDPNSTYGMGNAQGAYPSGYDPVSDRAAGENPPQKPPRPADGRNVADATAGVAAMNVGEQAGSPTAGAASETPLARAKAAEAADEARMNREREARERRELDDEMTRHGRNSMAGAPPGYSEMAPEMASGAADGAQEQPPAYVDDGAAPTRAGAGDSKGAQSSS
ncbi:hypothetical protein M406DRAFT_356035 [Cryphonectria parasitica EP155]|uniref:Ysc84 actin-binding domain-containing protein n=1 Tax=Cryphonectria parasitica (strain ATCC 38755 / EP155) TaxID=660469 RepID=A0A9P5CPS8_CRYP1|nr:uncharacterized protein M406DRAFT_356035 [Cryphonectria parasitica EP155]KAF3765737.1 hypothetical protein M406DRAFT_356035 [Cryphonectria parasitica EP155]